MLDFTKPIPLNSIRRIFLHALSHSLHRTMLLGLEAGVDNVRISLSLENWVQNDWLKWHLKLLER